MTQNVEGLGQSPRIREDARSSVEPSLALARQDTSLSTPKRKEDTIDVSSGTGDQQTQTIQEGRSRIGGMDNRAPSYLDMTIQLRFRGHGQRIETSRRAQTGCPTGTVIQYRVAFLEVCLRMFQIKNAIIAANTMPNR